ncbi:hypothetical protein PRZ48_006576 [Zasmidium cellare]|uniref:Uncharacterized protein n=1 Tax=Zasmidium cellare TaxID=395010 RepID=A0ABR0ENH2_ZASCE|nr:hypothetical protein PRZ48_006576 [Zasmidium cellare]
MTQRGKCETCRRRKVKSTITEPKHEDRDEEDRITLRLRHHSKAIDGDGEFLTFQSVRPSAPGPLLLCPRARMTANLGSIFGYAALNLAPLGPWIRIGWPSSIDSDGCLELASQYALESIVAFQHGHSEQSLDRASKTGVTALRSLQRGIETCQKDEERQALILAVMMHFAAEIGSALHSGQPSQLEPIARPQYSLTSPPSLDIATSIVNDFMIRIPRITCAVRACLQDPDNPRKISEAYDLAKGLYHSENATWIQKTIDATSTSHPSPFTPSGFAFTFTSTAAHALASRYFLSRLLISGLLTNLSTIPLSRIFFSPTFAREVESAEIAAAISISKCLDFALRPNPAQDLIACGMIMPLEVCLGTWSRVQKRSTADSEKYSHAAEMQKWCIKHLQSLCARWRAGPIPRENWEAIYDVLVGGELVRGTYELRENGVGLAGGGE